MERLITEEMLRQSEARFRAAFDQSHVGAVIVDQDLRFQRVNPAFCRIIGYTFEELASMNVGRRLPSRGPAPKSGYCRRFLR
jgi:PAS domain S-box-containing protein